MPCFDYDSFRHKNPNGIIYTTISEKKARFFVRFKLLSYLCNSFV